MPLQDDTIQIRAYISSLAAHMEINPSRIMLTDGRSLGCLDAHLLSIVSGNKLVSEFILQSELDNLKNRNGSELLAMKIKAALVRLKLMQTS